MSSNNYGTFGDRLLTLMYVTRTRHTNRQQRNRSYSFSCEVDPNSPFRIVENMQGVRYDSDEEEQQQRAKKRSHCGIIDYSEPFLYVLSVLNAIALVYISIVDFSAFMVVVLIYAIIMTFVAIFRVRKLGMAKSIMESVLDLKAENKDLKSNIQSLNTEVTHLENLSNMFEIQTEELREENKKLMKISGLLGENVEDINEAKKILFNELNRIEVANTRYEANNLMNLFFLVDRDQGGSLSENELVKMNTYIEAVYGFNLDILSMDKNTDGKVDISEFVAMFEQQVAQKADQLIEESSSIPDLVDIEIHGNLT